MRRISAIGIVFTLAASWAPAGEPLKSGPQGGPFPLYGLQITGPWAGKRENIIHDLRTNPRPSVFVFTRTAGKEVIRLIKRLDAEAARSRVFVSVGFLSTDKGLPAQLNSLVKKEKIRAALLTVIDHPRAARPGGISTDWNISKKAEVTVILYNKQRRQMANFAFRAGELQEKDIDRIVATFTKLPRRD